MEVKRESLMEAWSDLQPLLRAHWEEFQGHSGVPFDPAKGEYELLEEAGITLFVSARVDDRIVGYWLGAIFPNLHSKDQLCCSCDGMYLLKEYRNGAGREILQTVETEAKKRGVARLLQGTCVRHPIDPWLKRQGFELEDRIYIKGLN